MQSGIIGVTATVAAGADHEGPGQQMADPPDQSAPHDHALEPESWTTHCQRPYITASNIQCRLGTHKVQWRGRQELATRTWDNGADDKMSAARASVRDNTRQEQVHRGCCSQTRPTRCETPDHNAANRFALCAQSSSSPVSPTVEEASGIGTKNKKKKAKNTSMAEKKTPPGSAMSRAVGDTDDIRCDGISNCMRRRNDTTIGTGKRTTASASRKKTRNTWAKSGARHNEHTSI